MAKQRNHTSSRTEDLVSALETLRQKVLELAGRLAGGDSSAFHALKFQKRALKQTEQALRFAQKRERRLAWGI